MHRTLPFMVTFIGSAKRGALEETAQKRSAVSTANREIQIPLQVSPCQVSNFIIRFCEGKVQ